MKIDIIKDLAENSPYEGERIAAKEALKRISETGKDIKDAINLKKSVLHFRRMFRPLTNKWVDFVRVVDYSTDDYDFWRKLAEQRNEELPLFEVYEGKFIYKWLWRKGGNKFYFATGRLYLTNRRTGQTLKMKRGILPAGELISVNTKAGSKVNCLLQEFLLRVSFSTKKLPQPLDPAK
jgi:hypothetical protein